MYNFAVLREMDTLDSKSKIEGGRLRSFVKATEWTASDELTLS